MANEHERQEPEGVAETPAPLNRGEQRVVDRLRRARAVASAACPETHPKLRDLIEIAELISDEGG